MAEQQEYRICVSETSERLASEVNEHLSQGWELYGHPFVLGSNGAGSSYCQAVVRGAVSYTASVSQPAVAVTNPVEAPEPVAPAPVVRPKPVRPPRPRVAASFRNVATFLAVTMGSYLLIEALIFRSGLYVRYLEPESHSGAFENLNSRELRRPPSGRKEVLVLGSSRMAEDFSAKQANELQPNDGYWFINGAIPHGRDRSWYYFVREVDPHRNRYKSILIPIEDYDDPDTSDDVPDRVVDLRLAISRLRLTDVLPFTFSFRTWRARFEVLRGSLLKGAAYQLDFQQFFEDPPTRMLKAPEWRIHQPDWFYEYGGIHHALTGLQVDWKTRRVIALPPDNQGSGWQKFYDDGLIDNTPQNGIVRAIQVRWLGDLVDLYRGSPTKIIVYQVPRGPAMPPYPRAHLPWTTVDVLAKRPWVTIVDRHKFELLEKPEYFGDLLHLNSDGRAIFTPMLANLAKEIVH
jgi:hypothetical protein